MGSRPAMGDAPPGPPFFGKVAMPLANQPPAPFRPPDLPGPVFPANQQKPPMFLPPQQDSGRAFFSPPPLQPSDQAPPAKPVESGPKYPSIPVGVPQAPGPQSSEPPKYEVPKPSFFASGELPQQAPKPVPPVFPQPMKAPQSDPWVNAKRSEEGKANMQFPAPTYQFNPPVTKSQPAPAAIALREPEFFSEIRAKTYLDASGDTWSCPKCTFQIGLEYIQCEMCQYVNEPLKKMLEALDKPGKMHEKSIIQGGKEAVKSILKRMF